MSDQTELERECDECASYVLNRISIAHTELGDNFELTKEQLSEWIHDHFKGAE
jgi:hypothetical protein